MSRRHLGPIVLFAALLLFPGSALCQDRPSEFPACIGDGCDPTLPNLPCSFVSAYPNNAVIAAGPAFCQQAGYLTGHFWPTQDQPGGRCGITNGNVVCQ
jgi:hypothetical protein